MTTARATASGLVFTAEGERAIATSRVFDAPRAAVFRCFTEPALIRRWLFGPDGWTFVTCEFEARVGGRVRYVWRRNGDPATDLGLDGEVREIAPPEVLACTERFNPPWYEGEALGRWTFTESAGRTTARMVVTYASRAVRDGVLASGATAGMEAGMERIARVLAEETARQG